MLLIKSKYAVIFLETVDEEYVLSQLAQIAREWKFSYFEWSVTEGLCRDHKEGSYYQTKEPGFMLRTILSFLGPILSSGEPGLFVLKDFERYLDDAVVLRLFKDFVNKIRNTWHTVIIVASTYKLPQDLEPYTAYIIGGYPAEEEISNIIRETVSELYRNNPQIKISLTADEIKKIAKTFNGLSVQQIRNVLSECVLDDNNLDINDLPRIENCKKKIFDREGVLEFCLSESRENIADFDNLKRWLAERKHAFHIAAGLPPPKGVLMMGVQGCGKSLAIKVVARELNLPLYRLDLTKLYSKYIGQTEENLRKALKIVEKLSPMCLWIDEIEKCFAASDGEIDGGVSQRILGTFLTWMQERLGGCFMAATANNIYMLPPEFLRKGRFDEIFFVDLPNEELRSGIFAIHLAKRGLKPEEFDCGLLAKESADFNGAEIEQAVISALYRATSKKEPITTEHIIEQLHSTKPLAVVKQEDVAMLRNWAKDRTISA
ncbi:MAG: AAA family ATPase [Sedimentisphaerales bacterium]|nr:AAA family ATPase [Sedimentisphaerales bacterium]